MIVGVDLDGVGYDFSESVDKWFEMIGLPHKSVGSALWNFYEEWGMSRSEFDQHVSDGVDAGVIFAGGARLGFAYSMWRMKREGHYLHIITHRWQGSPGRAELATKDWLRNNGIVYDALTFSADKTCVYTDMFVEDRIENYDALVAAGTDAYLINRPWNLKGPDDRQRIDSIRDFADIVCTRIPEYV